MGWDGNTFWVDLGKAVVQVAGLSIHLPWLALAPRNIVEVRTHLPSPVASHRPVDIYIGRTHWEKHT